MFPFPFIFLPFLLFHRKCSFFPTLPLAKREEQGWAEVSLWSANPCLSILQFNRPVSVLQHFWRKFLFLLYSFFFFFLEIIKMFRYRNVLSVFIFLVSSSCNIWCFSCNFIKVVNKTWRRYQQYYWGKKQAWGKLFKYFLLNYFFFGIVFKELVSRLILI